MKTILSAALFLAPALAMGQDLSAPIRLLAEREAGDGYRVEVTVGAPSSALRLAPCSRAEPFVPAGARLWGRTTLGVRCVHGATWQAFLPVHVRVYGPAPLAARMLARGDIVTEGDIRHGEAELSLYPPGAIADMTGMTGKQLTRSVAAGQAVLAGWLRPREVFAQGDTVRVVYAGSGFTVTAEGRALSNALEGLPARIAVESGRTVTGIARAGRTVDVTP
jgi:flagella basal body P-ring formation protein FlgA